MQKSWRNLGGVFVNVLRILKLESFRELMATMPWS